MKKHHRISDFARLTALALLLASATACLKTESAVVVSASDVWVPQKTRVFMVNLLEWEDTEHFKPFPKENRRDDDLLDVWRRNGVPENQIYKLKDTAATGARIENVFENFLSQSQPDEWLIVYYSGHGYRDDDGKVYLASYDANKKGGKGWAVDSIPDTIDRLFKGRRAIIALDNCNSGAIVDAVRNRRSKVSYAALATTPANSSSTGNWTFTESLINAFSGKSYLDKDKNGRITFDEMIANSAEDMLFYEEQLAQSALTGDFDERTVLTRDAAPDKPRAGERVEAFDGEDWYRAIITDNDGEKLTVHFYGDGENLYYRVKFDEVRAFTPKTYKIGERIEAESGGEWYPARIVETKSGAHLVTYDDYDESFDEWLPSDCIRPAKIKGKKRK